MSLESYIQGLDIENPIDLFTVANYFIPSFPITHFCNIEGNIVYRGITYSAIACKIQWVPKDSEGIIKTKLVVSDISGTVRSLIDNYGLLGATIKVIRTWAIFLDGQPGADSLAYRSFEMRINQYTGTFLREFEFDLVPAQSIDRRGGRRYLKRCLWQLSDANCQASNSSHYDLSGNSTVPENRACRKDLSQCRQYHGNINRFGGFPGVQWRRS